MIGKCNTGGGENLTTQLNNQDAIITELEAKVQSVSGNEDVTPEVTAQTPVITQIAENLGVTIATPSGTNKQILQGNNANLLNIKNNAKKEGAYVWKKLTAEGGDFVDFVVSDNSTAYPDGGTQDGYWYEKMVERLTPEMFGCTKMAVDKFTFSSRSYLNNTLSHSLGEIPKVAIVTCNNTPTVNYDIDFAITLQCSTSPYYTATRMLSSSKTLMNAYKISTDYRTDTTIQLLSGSYGGTQYFTAGVEYTLITMA